MTAKALALGVLAPAKINLALHVTGRRADGYHLLDSLVAFAPVGDRLLLTRAEAMMLKVTGPEGAGLPEGPENLVWRAAAFLPGAGPVRVVLDKRLPAASGIGGGSSDAAAMLRGLGALYDVAVSPDGLERLGADVPMCLDPVPARVRGIGEEIAPVALPPLPALLVNPRVAVATPPVFAALSRRDNPALPDLPHFAGVGECIDWLARQRNDLEAPAISIAPVIGEVRDLLKTLPGCRLARMSGSGATCFALFATLAEAEAARARLAALRPGWWMASGALGDQSKAVAPRAAPQ